MAKEAHCLKVPKRYGEKALVLLNKLGLTDLTLQILKENSVLSIPLKRKPDEQEGLTLKNQIPQANLATGSFREKSRKRQTIMEILADQLSPHLLASLPKAFDVIGDIAIVEIPSELDTVKTDVGKAILAAHKNVRTVLAKAGAVSGTYRLRSLTFLAGEQKTVTLHREYGCAFYVDVVKAYFSPRLSHEHWRISSITKPGEKVVDLFAGVGPFAILIAKRNTAAKVYALDINAEAVELLERNVRLNRVENRVRPLLGDARQIVDQKLGGVADRVIMNLPANSAEFIDVACKALRQEGGVVHFYAFIRAPDTLDNLKKQFSESVKKAGRRVDAFPYANTVRETAPFQWQVVLDAEIR